MASTDYGPSRVRCKSDGCGGAGFVRTVDSTACDRPIPLKDSVSRFDLIFVCGRATAMQRKMPVMTARLASTRPARTARSPIAHHWISPPASTSRSNRFSRENSWRMTGSAAGVSGQESLMTAYSRRPPRPARTSRRTAASSRSTGRPRCRPGSGWRPAFGPICAGSATTTRLATVSGWISRLRFGIGSVARGDGSTDSGQPRPSSCGHTAHVRIRSRRIFPSSATTPISMNFRRFPASAAGYPWLPFRNGGNGAPRRARWISRKIASNGWQQE